MCRSISGPRYPTARRAAARASSLRPCMAAAAIRNCGLCATYIQWKPSGFAFSM